MAKMINLMYISLQLKNGKRNLNIHCFMNLRSCGNTGPRWAERPDSSPAPLTHPHSVVWASQGTASLGISCARRAGLGTEQMLHPCRVTQVSSQSKQSSEGARDIAAASSNLASVYASVQRPVSPAKSVMTAQAEPTEQQPGCAVCRRVFPGP